MKNKLKKISQQGSMMVEALAMLGLITMVTPVLYKKAAERTTELQDINTATQLRTLSKALDDFIQDNYNDIAEGPEGEVTVDKADIIPYLPYNFNLDESKLFGDYQFALRNELIYPGTDKEHSAITGVVLAPTSSDMPMLRASKIASMVGANGGVVRSNEIQGVQGGWSAPLGDFGFGNAPDGSLATSSVHAVTSSGAGADPKHVLFRDDSKGDIDYNTMQTNLYMGGFDIDDVENIIALNDRIHLDAGTVETTGNLSVGADANVIGGLTAASADISGLLKAGTAEILGTANIGGALTGGSTATFADKLTVSGGGADITGDAAISGLTTISGGAVVSGAAKKGAAAVTDTENTSYSLVSDGNLLVQANAHVTGDMKIDQALIANSLYGELGIGGGKLSDGNYNFIANADEVSIAGNNFQVGSDTDPRLLTDDSRVQASVGSSEMNLDGSEASLASAGSMLKLNDAGDALLDGTNRIELKIVAGNDYPTYMTMDSSGADIGGNNINAVAGNARLAMSNGSARLGLGSVTSDSSGSTVYGSNVAFSSTGAVLTGDKGSGVRVPLVSLSGGDITAEGDLFEFNDNFRMDDDDIVFDESAAEPNRGVDNIYNNRSSGVRIMREGIIQLPVGKKISGRSDLGQDDGKQNVPGYIKLDRIIANQMLDKVVANDGDNGYQFSGKTYNAKADHPYDAYQINPAYTSVMHDIKLTTRGGARLSDILPDFINKGIYVLDNTYKEEEGKREWDDYEINPGSGGQPVHVEGPGECTSSDCIASPWLGFVPTPQCPPGYSKVITISPIRWKMAEAYTVAGEKPTPGLSFNESFNRYFMPVRDPVNVQFKLEEVDGSNGLHTHQVVSGWPLTFQTNTWLNTTVSGKRDDGTTVSGGARTDSFLGWHAIMGFLYYANDYQEYLKSLGQNLKDVVIWNLFPVYNEEMTAIANVYCYFERRKMTGPVWQWNSNLVDGGSSGYDQLTNFRSGYTKNNSGYRERLNDPALEYDEVW